MQAPDETTFKLFDYAWAVIGALIGVVWNMLNARIKENKLHHEKELHTAVTTLDRRISENSDEADTQRTHIAKLFDKLEQHSKDSFTRHIELMNAISNKADK